MGANVDIRSTPSGYGSKTQAGRAREILATVPAKPGVNPAGATDETPVDRVELSTAARELNARLENGQEAGGLSAERIRQLATRVQNGYYDRADTIDRVLQGVLAELTRGDTAE